MANIHHPALATEALDLPAPERAQLAVLLFDSVADQKAVLWPEQLVTELNRRADELRSGKVHGLSDSEVFGELR